MKRLQDTRTTATADKVTLPDGTVTASLCEKTGTITFPGGFEMRTDRIRDISVSKGTVCLDTGTHLVLVNAGIHADRIVDFVRKNRP